MRTHTACELSVVSSAVIDMYNVQLTLPAAQSQSNISSVRVGPIDGVFAAEVNLFIPWIVGYPMKSICVGSHVDAAVNNGTCITSLDRVEQYLTAGCGKVNPIPHNCETEGVCNAMM